MYISQKYRKTLLVIAATLVLFISLNFVLYSFDQTPPLQFNKPPEGSLREKYLKSLTNIHNERTDRFSSKWTALGHLDDIINEQVVTASFNNSIDPFTLIKELEMQDDTFDFNKLPLINKIKLYTTSILPNSTFTFHEVQEMLYKGALNEKNFSNERMKKWAKIKEQLTESELKKLGINDKWFQEKIEDVRQARLAHNLISVNEIRNTFTNLKFFSNFFLRPENDVSILYSKNTPQYLDYCKSFSDVLFGNWLSSELPTFRKLDRDLNEEIVDMHPHKIDNCFVKMLHANMKGRGIVLTAGDRLVPELTGLLALLRIMGNKYPLQIFYNNDLSSESMRAIIDIGTSPVLKLPESISQDKIKNPENPLPLDITFVDVSNTISNYHGHFNGFGMKLLAYFFNTFEEMVMIDTDTVMVEPIEKFFKSPKYTSTKAYFFKDRDADSFIYEGVIDYIKKCLNYEEEVHYLNLPRVTYETLNNRFFSNRAKHFMESGLFVVNRREKFDGVIASLILQMFRLFSDSTHGEKEFIWLGQEIMGQPYTLNNNAAISIGELTPDDGNSITRELCSTHPGHIDNDKKTLLWFNSGFLHCKKTGSYKGDLQWARNEGKTLLELKHQYEGPLHITHGLIPPPAEYMYDAKNGEPTRGWSMTSECSGYLWCAYDTIGGLKNPKIPKGEIISFEPDDTKAWEYFGRVWVNYFNIGEYLISEDTGYQKGVRYEDIKLDENDSFRAKPDPVDEH